MRDANTTLFYLPSINKFVDEQWIIVHIIPAFHSWQLDQWKRSAENNILTAQNGSVWALYYLDEAEENDILEVLCRNECCGVKTDRIYY